jgi:hypothetical protein
MSISKGEEEVTLYYYQGVDTRRRYITCTAPLKSVVEEGWQRKGIELQFKK